MTTLVLRFPAGRYRTAPWASPGYHDGPPSPWRLLRALHSTWRTRLPALPAAEAHPLLDALAVPPTWYVPPSSVSVDGAGVLDHDVDLVAAWPGRLPADQHDTLARLAAALPYLGRAESRCAARIDDTWTATPQHRRWEPLDTADTITPGRSTAVLAPALPLDPSAFTARPLHALTGRAVLPDGARLVAYQRQPHAAPALPTAIRLTVLGQRPPATATVAVTDLLRRAALAHLGLLRPVEAFTRLGGRDADASVLRDAHAHTSYLPVITDGEITAIIASTPGGLPPDEVAALRSVVRLTSNRQRPVQLAPSSPGAIRDLAPETVGPATTWTSVTPYTPSRYPKKRDWPTFLLDDLTRELHHRALPAPLRVDLVNGDWRAWQRHRPSAPRTSAQGRVTRDSAFLHLTLTHPIDGPLVLGHLSHFGLGLFRPHPPHDGESLCERSGGP